MTVFVNRPARARERTGARVRLSWSFALVAGPTLAFFWIGATSARARPVDDAETAPRARNASAARKLFGRDNLIAWCIVPFDSQKRGPEARAAMLERLGFKHFAYDWRVEHVPTFDAEIQALKKHHVSLDAWWVAPGELNRESRAILDVLKKHGARAELWALLDFGPDRATGAEQERRVAAAVAKLGPLAKEAGKVGCTVALYNHGGWFGEPENQIEIIERLKKQGIENVGMVYNLHHGHAHLDRFPALLKLMLPYLKCLNINGMDRDGEQTGRKILPLGQGELDLDLLKTVRDSGYRGPIGILGHTMDDAEARLRDNLDGLDWLLPQLDGNPPGPRPHPRTPVPPRPASSKAAGKTGANAAAPRPNAARVPNSPPVPSSPLPPPLSAAEARRVAEIVHEAQHRGDPERGAMVFASPKFACLSCHRVGAEGGPVGPDLSTIGATARPEEIVESVLWPRRRIKEGYAVLAVALNDGNVRQGYPVRQSDAELVLNDPATGGPFHVPRDQIEAVRDAGTLMPDGLADAMTQAERVDLARFLIDLGRNGARPPKLSAHLAHAPAEFVPDRAPRFPERRPSWRHRVNRDRIYNYYSKEAEHFMKVVPRPMLLPQFPGLDGGGSHWGNQGEPDWVDDRWNQTDLGELLCGVFRGAGATVSKGVCVRLGDRGELAACFNPETLCYEALWKGGFLKFSDTRHGILGGLIMDGTPLPRPEGHKPDKPFVYRGFYRHGRRVIFSYSIDGVEMLDAPWAENGRFVRQVGPASSGPLARLVRGGGPPRWPQVFKTRGQIDEHGPYAIDTITPPFDNPWKALLFFGGHDFLPDGSALVCTIEGDVWHVSGLDETLRNVEWRRYATGLHQALGLLIAKDEIYVLGRDQITRLHDLDGDGEADFYECFCNKYETSTSGHDFVSGLQRDAAGRFYTASSKQGVLRIAADGRSAEAIATGFRNPDGLGLSPEGAPTVPCSEGEWTPASMVCEVREGGHYGYPGPREGRPPDLPLVYLPRGLDNSSAEQIAVPNDDRFGPLAGQMLHLSYGAGTYFLLLRETVAGQPQGAVVPMPGEFLSGAHRARFNPRDGRVYVSGMAGWGTYTPLDGCFQRIRYTGGPVQLPMEFHAHENGVILKFTGPVDRAVAERADNHFVQAWNYRYGAAYGSPEFSPGHPGVPGHDALPVRSAHVLADGRTLFLEIPDLQPVNQLHLHVRTGAGPPHDAIATVHRLAPPFTGFPGFRPSSKTIAAHPILADMIALKRPPVPNPWRDKIPHARVVKIEAGKNLSYTVRSFQVRADEPIELNFVNPDSVPHNWALVRPGALARVGALANQLIAEPDAAHRQYVPQTDDVLAYTDIVPPQESFKIFFRAPGRPGAYPYLCTFPGHWMVMNGTMIVTGP